MMSFKPKTLSLVIQIKNNWHPPMKTIISIFLLFTPLFFFAQSNEIESLKEELKTLDSIEFVKKAIILSDEYYKQGKYQGASGAAVHAYRVAKEINDKEAMAAALNREGKAMLRQKNRKGNNANIALKFMDSNKLLEQVESTNDALRLSNLKHLKRMAQQLNRTKDFNDLERQIRELQASSKNALSKDTLQAITDLLEHVDEKNLKPRQRRAYNKLKEVYSKELESNQQIVQDMEQAKEDLEKMNEEQVKTELLNMKYKMLVDSLATKQMMDSVSIVQKDAQLREQKAVLERQRARRSLYFAIITIVVLLAGGLFVRNRAQRKHNSVLEEKNVVIEKEKERSESLLLNILPETIAKELKTHGKAKARYHNNVSVLFADFVNFSGISEKLSPEELIENLDYCFKNFDKIIGKYELEKIKTIGDSYMVAGGLTIEQPDHAQRVIKAAIEIQFFLQSLKKEKEAKNEPFFEARIGIHVGPIIAGVVGLKKFAYDIWGDTVNVASRMESSGEPGKVNISEDTYNQVKDDFAFEYRGKVEAKNKGKIDMYYVLESYN
jgi:class 3 adenylate cyclase